MIETYTDFVVERLEIASLVMVFATYVAYALDGGLASAMPCVAFHGIAYLGFKSSQKRSDEQRRLLIKDLRKTGFLP